MADAAQDLDLVQDAAEDRIEDDPSLLGSMDMEENHRLAAFWREEITAVDHAQNKWIKKVEAIIKRYRDERNKGDDNEGMRRMNILWSTVQTLHPALYGRMPQAIAERKFLDRDPTGRVAAQMLQRSLRNELDASEYDETCASSVLDYLLAGRGQAWVRYEPRMGSSVSLPATSGDDLADDEGNIAPNDTSEGENKLEETGEQVIGESIPVDYVSYSDFYMIPARSRRWSEVQAVGKRVYMSRDELKERFGKSLGKKIPLNYSARDGITRISDISAFDTSSEARKAEIYEIWNKTDRRVYWIAEGFDQLCDCREDPLELRRFFPCPRPLVGTSTNDTLLPVPDYHEWQDQAIQVDELTQRISILARACKVAGTYNAAEFAVRRMFDESVENQLIPVDDWAAFAEKGGVPGSFSLMPLKETITVLQELITVRTEVLRNLDQVTGISDIMRGTSDARETLGGQRLKSNYSTIRLTKRQKEVARFCRDIIALMAEIICSKFSEESLIEASGALFEEGIGDYEVTAQSQVQPAAGADLGGMAAGPQGSAASGGPNQLGMPVTPPGMPGGGSAMPPGPGVGPASVPPAPQGSAPGPQSNVVPFPGVNSNMPGMGVGSPAAGSEGQPAPSQPGLRYSPPGARGGPPLGMLEGLSGIMGLGPLIPGQEPPSFQTLVKIAKAILLLRHDKRGFRIEIETDSTIQEQADEDKQSTIQFLESLTKFISAAGQIVMLEPESAPMLGKCLQFGVRKFRTGRDLESAIDDFCDKMEKKSKAAEGQPKPPSPEQIKMQMTQIQAQAEIQKAQIDGQSRIADAEATHKGTQLDLQAKQAGMQMDQQKGQSDMELKRQQAELTMAQKQREFELKMAQLEREAQLKEAEHGSRMAEMVAKSTQPSEGQMQPKSGTKAAKPAPKAAAQPQAAKTPPPPEDSPAPMHGAKKAPDGHWYLPDEQNSGKWLRVIAA